MAIKRALSRPATRKVNSKIDVVRDLAQRSSRSARKDNGVCRRGGTDVGVKAISVYNVNRTIEQTGDVVFQSGVVENGDVSRSIKLDHDVDITVGPIVPAARFRASGALQGFRDCS